MSFSWLALSILSVVLAGCPANAEEIGLTATVSGEVIGYALPAGKDGGRELILLVEPRDDEAEGADAEEREESDLFPPCDHARTASRILLKLSLEKPDRLQPVELSQRMPLLGVEAIDFDMDGKDELAVYSPDGLYSLEDGRFRKITDLHSAARSVRFHPALLRDRALQDTGLLLINEVGLMRMYGPSEERKGWGPIGEIGLPKDVRLRGTVVSVSSNRARVIGEDRDGHMLLATDPVAVDTLRARVITAWWHKRYWGKTSESWIRFPGPERLMDYKLGVVRGEAFLVASTMRADKLSIFGEKKLRVWRLEDDRSRTGRLPLFQVQSRMNLWQEAEYSFTDVNSDRRPDLVVGYWKGLKDTKIALDVYLGNESGGFEEEPRTTAFNVPGGDRSFLSFGEDADRDGLADLLVASDEGLLLYRGQAGSIAKNIVDKEKPLAFKLQDLPNASYGVEVAIGGETMAGATFGEVNSKPVLVDMDGDDKPEILMFYRSDDRRENVLVVRIPN